MAVINNLKASFTEFKVNDVASRLTNCVGEYNTADLLNGGELVNNELSYKFVIQGLLGHTIQSIVVKALLLNADGSLATSRRIRIVITDYGSPYIGDFVVNGDKKTINSIAFNSYELQESDSKELNIKVTMPSGNSCYFAIQSLQINLQDINYTINIAFDGPRQGRTINTITCATLLLNIGAEPVTFSKDPLNVYDPLVDAVDGRMYLKANGIFVDGYQYGTVAPATETVSGIVKLKNNFEISEEDGGIIAPTELGTAASPQLVFNALASMKGYVDELMEGITAPDVFIEQEVEHIDEETGESTIVVEDVPLLEAVRLSDDFEAKEENRIYIKWLDII